MISSACRQAKSAESFSPCLGDRNLRIGFDTGPAPSTGGPGLRPCWSIVWGRMPSTRTAAIRPATTTAGSDLMICQIWIGRTFQPISNARNAGRSVMSTLASTGPRSSILIRASMDGHAAEQQNSRRRPVRPKYRDPPSTSVGG